MNILITGAARLGAVMAERLMREGHEVVVHGRKQIPPVNAPAVLQPLDCAEDAEILFDRVLEICGEIDAVICNAAAFERTQGFDVAPEMAERLWRTNALVPMVLTQRLYRHLTEREAFGQAIHILDQRITADDQEGCLPYALSKKTLADFTCSAAIGYAPRLRVNGVAPGAVLPPPNKGHSEKAGAFLTAARPTPEDVAAAVSFLLQSPAVTGQILFIDGGQHLIHSNRG